MTLAISAVTNPATSTASAVANAAVASKADLNDAKATLHANLHKVAKEFETLMVHQLLEAAKLGGDGKDGGYKGMVVDAAANGISQAGGLGLAKQIEDALDRAR